MSATYTATPTTTITTSCTDTPSFTDSPTVTDSPTISATPTPTPSPVPDMGVTVQIFNSAGEMIYTGQKMMFNHALTGVEAVDAAFIPGGGATTVIQMLGAGGTFTWTGCNANGQTVAAGVYTLNFTETGTGSVTPLNFSVQVTVLSAQSPSSISIFNSAGELVQYFPLPTDSAAELNLSSNSFVPEAGKPGLTISWGPGSGDSVQWNGLNSNGDQVASGIYRVQLTSEVPGSSSSVTLKAFVQVLDPAVDLLGGALVGPNPMVGSAQTLTVYAPGLQASDSLEIGLYDLAGQLVVKGYGQGPTQQLAVPGTTAGGIFMVVLEAHSAETGASERVVLKLAIAR
jgi:hypothetical protein